jgi:hypothetical protein
MPIMIRKNTSRYPIVSPNAVNVKLCPHAVSDSGSHASASTNTHWMPPPCSRCGIVLSTWSSPANSTGIHPGEHFTHSTSSATLGHVVRFVVPSET